MDADAIPTGDHLARLLAVLQKGLGHELPNQLVAMQGMARLLELEEGERLSPEGQGYLGRLANGAAKAHALVSALAEVARLTHPPAPPEAVRLPEIVAEAIAEAKQLAPGGPVEYYGSVPDLLLSAPRLALRRVLVLLLRRAETVCMGERPVRIEVNARPGVAGAEICVAGDGLAIPPEQLERLFEPFVGSQGHGLDLFLARQLAEGWGGAVRVEGRPDRGCELIVTCPLSGESLVLGH
jgi:signal transduction histidine kinase